MTHGHKFAQLFYRTFTMTVTTIIITSFNKTVLLYIVAHWFSKFLQANTFDFIHSDAWPPNSLELNPLDYYVWNALKELVYAGGRKPFLNTDKLKQVIIKEKWSILNDRHIQKSIGQWKQRLRVVTREGGGPIKHLFAENVSYRLLLLHIQNYTNNSDN